MGALHQLGSQWEERELGPDELACTLRASGPYGSQYWSLFYLFNLFNQWQALLTEWRAQRLFQRVIHFLQSVFTLLEAILPFWGTPHNWILLNAHCSVYGCVFACHSLYLSFCHARCTLLLKLINSATNAERL